MLAVAADAGDATTVLVVVVVDPHPARSSSPAAAIAAADGRPLQGQRIAEPTLLFGYSLMQVPLDDRRIQYGALTPTLAVPGSVS
jgi:hypothetical protein